MALTKIQTEMAGTGAVVQMVSTVTGAVATGTTQIPFDDTIPQSAEGDQYMSLSITPKATTNKLQIEVVFFGAHSGSARVIAALFQDSTANAIAVGDAVSAAAGNGVCIKFTHVMTAGTTSSTTFKVRAGSASAGTTTFNGAGGTRSYGGVMASSIVITEFAA